MNDTKRGRWVVVATVAALLAVSCAHQPPASGSMSAVMSFFMGLLHGFLMLVSLIVGLFTDVRIYAFPNTGFLYDLGYVIGASIFFGGGGAGASRKKR